MLPCGFKQLTGHDCPGCGFQRSVASLAEGNFTTSFEFYPPLALILTLFFLLIIHLIFNLKHGAVLLKWTFIGTSLSILVNYVLKITNLI
jgi:hypothetical protein